MTTDTAVRVTRIIVQDKVNVEDIPYIDHPDLKVDEHESVEMPFRYVRDKEGKPIMPEVIIIPLSLFSGGWDGIVLIFACREWWS